MIIFLRALGAFCLITALFFAAGCVAQKAAPVADTAPSEPTTIPTSAPLIAQATPTPNSAQDANTTPITLPLLDAIFADQVFVSDVKSKLQLTDEQIAQIRSVARKSVASLNEANAGGESTSDANQRATAKVGSIIGANKTAQLFALARAYWQGGASNTAAQNQTPTDGQSVAKPDNELKPSSETQPNAVPADTRIVVNIPAYRMDVFKNGNLIKTYRIGIGYPEFPLPTGIRKASTIIFNPTWTPPNEPWVAHSNKVKVGEKIEAGDKLNPLGPIKIPIGLPSLIHGGKSPAKIGTFASHGCVGLTNSQVQRFALALAEASGTDLTQADILNYAKNPTKTESVKLTTPVPVELRYETIVVSGGKLHIYRDVYGYGKNTESNLRRVLENYGVSFDELSADERAQVLKALREMARDATGNDANANPRKPGKAKTPHVTRALVGKKEIVIALPELTGKGYPAPVNLDAGGAPQPSRKSQTKKTAAKEKKQT